MAEPLDPSGTGTGYGVNTISVRNTPIPYDGLSTIPGGTTTPPEYYHGEGSFLNNNNILVPSAIKYRQQAVTTQNLLANLMIEWGKRLAQYRQQAGAKGGGSGLTKADFDSSGGEYKIRTGGQWQVVDEETYLEAKSDMEMAEETADGSKRQKTSDELMAEAALAEIDSFMKGLNVKAETGVLPDDPNAPKVPDKNAPGTKGNSIKVDLDTFKAALASQETSSGYRPKWMNAPITQGFGPTNEPLDAAYGGYEHFNKGLDFGIPVGTPIDAAVGGTVISAGDAGDGWGISVKIKDANGLTHNYGHLDSALVKPGEKVSAGVVIGNSGDTGKSTGPHLSYDVWDKDSKFIDPARVISADGGYSKVNARTGAYGRYQILPGNWKEWATAAGVPDADPSDPAMQEYVTEHRLSLLMDKYNDWNKVAAAWYAGETGSETSDWTAKGVNGEPSIQEYVNSVMGKVEAAALAGSQGTLTPGGTYVSVGGGGSSGSGSSSPPKKPDPLLDYLNSGAYKIEGERADEYDRRYDNVSKRMKDYLSAAGMSNDLLKDIQTAIGNEAALKKLNQNVQDDAIATASNVNAAVNAGKLGYRDALAGPIWSNSMGSLEKELQAIRAAMETAPPGFANSILSTIPKNVPMEYYVDDELGLPGYTGAYWGQPTQARYALGTIPRYAAGTLPFHLEPYLAAWQSGKYVPAQIARQFEDAGYSRSGTVDTPPTATGSTPVATTATPTLANSTYRPGYVPKNATLPPDMRVFDDGEWLDAAVSAAARNIAAGAQAPASWGLGDLSGYVGMPASQFDGGFIQALRSAIIANADSPEVIQAFGKRPGIETQWVPDPNAAPTKATPGTGSSNYGTGANTQAQYGGTYGGAMDPYDSARLELEKQQLALQKTVAEAQIKLDRDRYELEILKNTDAQAYQAAQIRWNDAKALLDQKNFDLSVVQQELQKTIFEDSVRRYEIETGMARESLDLAKIKQESDIAYQSGQLELARQAGALSQAEYEEKKRQFEETFGYQKEKDKREQDMQRAKISVDYLAKPGNAVASNFWYANQADPVGTTYDLFTGENRGDKTWQQMYEEDSVLANKPQVATYANGSMDGFMNDIAAILGDSNSNKATGNEELVYNPTGAPLMVISNEMSRAMGLVPPRGKKFGDHVRKGGAA